MADFLPPSWKQNGHIMNITLLIGHRGNGYCVEDFRLPVLRRIILYFSKCIKTIKPIKPNLICSFQCDAESNYLEQQYFNSQQQQHLPPAGSSTSSLPGGGIVYHPAPGPGPGGSGGGGAGQQPGGPSGPNQIDVVLSEVRDLTSRSHICIYLSGVLISRNYRVAHLVAD